MKNILIIGATSAIAQATARRYAQRGDNLYLLGRDVERLTIMAEDLRVRGAQRVEFGGLDVNNLAVHSETLTKVVDTMHHIDVVLMAQGTLPDQQACQKSVAETLTELNTNATSTISLLTLVANQLESQNSGTIAVITSVAGDRGRQSNYVYGAAKGMVSIFLQGLRNRLHPSGVQVLDIKPGFVDTPMTREFEKGFLWAQPEQIANSMVKAIDQQTDVVYAPWFWKYIMLVITLIPEPVFKRMKL